MSLQASGCAAVVPYHDQSWKVCIASRVGSKGMSQITETPSQIDVDIASALDLRSSISRIGPEIPVYFLSEDQDSD